VGTCFGNGSPASGYENTVRTVFTATADDFPAGGNAILPRCRNVREIVSRRRVWQCAVLFKAAIRPESEKRCQTGTFCSGENRKTVFLASGDQGISDFAGGKRLREDLAVLSFECS